MKPVLVLILLVLLNLTPRLAGQGAAYPQPSQRVVIVTGEADDRLASLADKTAAARLSACKLALREVAPVFVHSRALADANTLVANYQYVEVQGFIDKAEPLDSGQSSNDVFLQRYRVTVNTADFNLELIKKKIDVTFLYDLVNRPNICIAIDPESNGIIQRHFHERHRRFKFMDLTLLRSNAKEEADYVREARKNSFDVLIIGTTEKVAVAGKAGSPSAVSVVPIVIANERPLIKINWRVLNVHDQSIICSVADQRRDNPYLDNRDEGNTVVGQAAATLFRELLSAWNLASREKTMRISFEHFGSADPAILVRDLSTNPGLKRDTIRQENFTKTRIDFLAEPSLSLPELQSSLQRAFASDFTIMSVNDDHILLTLQNAKSQILSITVNSVGIKDLLSLEAKLKQLEGVAGVQRLSFSGGVAKLHISTHQTPDDVALALEEAFKPQLKTLGLTETSLEMSF